MKNVNYSTPEFEKAYTYTGADLGAVWSEKETRFRVWAPTAETVTLNLYESGTAGTEDLLEKISMQPDVNGTWIAVKPGNLNHVYYTYSVTIDGKEKEACDPYAKACGVNGRRAMVLNLEETNPAGWENDKDPHATDRMTDAVLYELHVRDLSVDPASQIENKGKFLGLAEIGTKTPSGHPTGLDYIKELGITHLHLLPSFDYGSVDEANLSVPQFNWGYDPVNYNVPEGSYATDPYHGEVRVREMKQMIKTLHENGISVVMDVVYNHVHDAESFCFNVLVPGYFSRINANGIYSNGSFCGNDTASERSMVKKFIVDSVSYWADEYHIDGFRFDLAGLLDTETINALIAEVEKKHPNVIFYGEGWTMPTEVTKEGYLMATQLNSDKTPKFAYFSDTIRDGLRGSVLREEETGYVTDNFEVTEQIKKCLLGQADWCKSPSQTVNYASCHDNNTLLDRISINMPNASFEEKVARNRLAAAIYMLSQGVPFLHAGEEILRTKVDEKGNFVENSYASSDRVNAIKWKTLDEKMYQDTLAYYKGLIQFRKAHEELRYATAEEVDANAKFMETPVASVIALQVKNTLMVFNPSMKAVEIELTEGTWDVCVNAKKAGTECIETIETGKVTVDAISAMVLVNKSL